jgi:hypothetical protein
VTITVSVEELRAYELACIAWAAKRSEFYGTQLVLVQDHTNFRSHVEKRPTFVTNLQNWDRENPAPRLLPAV